jgi:phosphoglycolate phosphatase
MSYRATGTGAHPAAPNLAGIDLVVFDKDGTLLSFDAMWGGWARELGRRLEANARRPVEPDVFAAIGYDPTSGRVWPSAPLAIGTMAQIEDLVARVLRRWCPSAAAARRVVELSWFEPDPVALAVPLADLASLFERVGEGGRRRIAVATTDDRAPTEASLRGLGVRDAVAALACGDDGIPLKPDPGMLLALCTSVGVRPERTAVVGDTPADLRMGRSAGAGLVVGVLSGLGDEDALAPLADQVVASVEAFL